MSPMQRSCLPIRYLVVLVAVALGERERAMELLRQLGGGMARLHRDPLLEPLWDYPPFMELLRPTG
jgi:hypothetical protein